MYTEHTTACLDALYVEYGPPLEKTAEAMYFYNATEPVRAQEALGDPFVKYAGYVGADPWKLAYSVATHMDGIVKSAYSPGPVGHLARFYVDWATEMEKRASIQHLIGSARMAAKGVKSLAGGGKRLVSRAGKRVWRGKPVPKVAPKAAYTKPTITAGVPGAAKAPAISTRDKLIGGGLIGGGLVGGTALGAALTGGRRRQPAYQ